LLLRAIGRYVVLEDCLSCVVNVIDTCMYELDNMSSIKTTLETYKKVCTMLRVSNILNKIWWLA